MFEGVGRVLAKKRSTGGPHRVACREGGAIGAQIQETVMTTEFIRRRVLAGADACLLLAPAIAAPEEGKKGKKAGEQKEVGAVEDLMREHGVLRRAQVRGHRK